MPYYYIMDKSPIIVETGKMYKDGKLYMPQRVRTALKLTDEDRLIWQVQRLSNGTKYIILSTEIIPVVDQGFSMNSVN